ncbi:alcohol dehydrogenase [Mycolicibacterium setense]|uniref:NDMA-dependent alcohol dehydrogenase n=1 Tax=Mycolicibacterium setense TaxID=431269 RepID=UPI0007E96F66|nr:NDMA-dependent alcohol dehydrogenase [Mycolicibacterium setense]OBB14645.1 alcohol dehydrogenase [Mycolicibacterium setense]
MKTRSAIVRQVPGKYEVVELDLDEPREGEVLVRMVAAGLCHSDEHIATGDLPVRTLPMCGGHEGAGVVEQVGPNVQGVSEGDHVVFTFLPVCGRCKWCSLGLQALCDLGAGTLHGSRPGDPTSYRMHLNGVPVGQGSCVSTFSEYTTVDARSVVVIPSDIPLEAACLVGCGVLTGWGAAVNSAEVRPGDVVVCMGIGGIGINAVQGAAHAGAAEVIAVDPVEFKRRMATEVAGATAAFADIAEATDYARSLTNGQGADKAICTVGVTSGEHVAAALSAVRKAGTLVVVGLGPRGDKGLPISVDELVLFQKRIQGCLFGASRPLSDIPMALDLYRSGRLKLDELITTRYSLDDIAKGYEDMYAGVNIRGLITF